MILFVKYLCLFVGLGCFIFCLLQLRQVPKVIHENVGGALNAPDYQEIEASLERVKKWGITLVVLLMVLLFLP